MTSWRHILWDWNGTLFDDAWLCVEVMNGLLDERGLPRLTPARYADLFGFPVIDYYRRLGFDLARESFETVGTEFIVRYERRRMECGLQPGALDLLRWLRARRLRQTVLSAYRQVTLVDLLARFGIEGIVEEALGGHDHYAHGKVEQARAWQRRTEARRGEAVLIGDTDHDADVAAAIGADCVLIPCGHQSPARLGRCGCPVLRGLNEVRDLIESREPRA